MAIHNIAAVAAQWAETQIELKRAEGELNVAKERVEHLRNHLTTLSERLSKGVGENVQTRVFNIDTGRVVVVQHKQAIKLIDAERVGDAASTLR